MRHANARALWWWGSSCPTQFDCQRRGMVASRTGQVVVTVPRAARDRRVLSSWTSLKHRLSHHVKQVTMVITCRYWGLLSQRIDRYTRIQHVGVSCGTCMYIMAGCHTT